MSDTPETDAAVLDAGFPNAGYVLASFARRLERERDIALEQRDALLGELDALTLVIGLTPIAGNKIALQEAFDSARAAIANAKETQPWTQHSRQN